MSAPGEVELLRRCRKGDEDAWNELFEAHYAATGRFVHQISAEFTREDVEEICQETFLTVIKNIFSFQGQSQFQTWLFRVAANKAHDYLERQQAAKRGGGQVTVSLQADEGEGLAPEPAATTPSPDLALINAENLALINQALLQLGNPCREGIEPR
jgi:RNA polymerase sigma-70 factor, ECF subfamily